MDFISWSSSLFKFSGYEGITPNQLQQLQQQAGLLSTGWPWIPEQPNGTNRPASSLILDLAVLEAAAINHFWHPTASNSFNMANFMSSTIMDKQHQLSFGIDRILGDQIGTQRTNGFPQVRYIHFKNLLMIKIILRLTIYKNVVPLISRFKKTGAKSCLVSGSRKTKHG